jgi:hypothetical protein
VIIGLFKDDFNCLVHITPSGRLILNDELEIIWKEVAMLHLINYGILLGTGTAQWYSAGLRAGCSGVRGPIGGWKLFSSPPRPDRPWVPLSLLSNAYQGLFP